MGVDLEARNPGAGSLHLDAGKWSMLRQVRGRVERVLNALDCAMQHGWLTPICSGRNKLGLVLAGVVSILLWDVAGVKPSRRGHGPHGSRAPGR